MYVVLSNHKDIISYHHLQRHKSGSYNFRCNEGIHVEMDSQRKIQVLSNMYKYIVWNSDPIIYTLLRMYRNKFSLEIFIGQLFNRIV